MVMAQKQNPLRGLLFMVMVQTQTSLRRGLLFLLMVQTQMSLRRGLLFLLMFQKQTPLRGLLFLLMVQMQMLLMGKLLLFPTSMAMSAQSLFTTTVYQMIRPWGHLMRKFDRSLLEDHQRLKYELMILAMKRSFHGAHRIQFSMWPEGGKNGYATSVFVFTCKFTQLSRHTPFQIFH